MLLRLLLARIAKYVGILAVGSAATLEAEADASKERVDAHMRAILQETSQLVYFEMSKLTNEVERLSKEMKFFARCVRVHMNRKLDADMPTLKASTSRA